MNFFKKQDLIKEIDSIFSKEDSICQAILKDFKSNKTGKFQEKFDLCYEQFKNMQEIKIYFTNKEKKQ